MRGRLDHAACWLLLRVAVVLEQRVASKTAARAWKLRRNKAMRAANRRGVPVEMLAARTGLTASWVRYVIRDPEKAAVEEAA